MVNGSRARLAASPGVAGAPDQNSRDDPMAYRRLLSARYQAVYSALVVSARTTVAPAVPLMFGLSGSPVVSDGPENSRQLLYQ